MNRTSKIAFAVAIASLSVAGIGHADTLAMNWGPELEKTLSTFNNNFDIRHISDYQNQKTQPDAHGSAQPRTDEGVEHIQQAIRSNKALLERLEAKGIKVNDVVNAEQAADGSLTFYIR